MSGAQPPPATRAPGTRAPRIDVRRLGLALAAPLLAVLVAFVVTTIILVVAKDPVGAVWSQLFKAPLPRQIVAIVNAATVFYLSAIAVAIGFRMNLFNIGVDGQYRVAAFAAAVFAGQGWLPGWLNILAALVVAMLAGGLWAGIAGLLKVGRGVSEVISTIMLNSIATFLVSFLLSRVAVRVEGSNAVNTKPLAEGSRVPGISVDGLIATPSKVYGLVFLAVVVGILYWFVLARTRFGFDLRATGRSETAAVASGVKVKRMVLTSMAISGGAAGLVGMPLLFGQDYAYGDTFQSGLGFAGIAIALLGRNNPIGIGFAALLWAYLDAQGNGLQINAGVSDRLVLVIQGVIVLSVVIAYELVRRAGIRMEQRRVASQLAARPVPATEGSPA
ncbi:ABC transporter permease [Lapillicoccus sp.]|uniref:ABC transporter permease n=1 Tax=Lapillicoccus sp. TaxID=1909287 RepID=UPI003982FAB1